jgi:streptogramin lyase
MKRIYESESALGRCALFVVAGTLGLGTVVTAQVPSRTAIVKEYTLDADFDEGMLLRVNHDIPDQLQLGTENTPFSFISVPSSGHDTMVRINVDTGEIIGEYRTAPEGELGSPSRSTVDQWGNTWIGNRNQPAHGTIGSVAQIGVVIGGTRQGEFLIPPFIYSTAIDRDGDGKIRTSSGLGSVFDWSLGQDSEDECNLLYTLTGNANIRHISVNGDGDVWLGGYIAFLPTGFELRDQHDGSLKDSFSTTCGGAGGVVDGEGVVWSTSLFENQLMRYDPAVGGAPTCIDVMSAPRGIDIDSQGFIWVAGSDEVWRLDGSGSILNQHIVPGAGTFYGVAALHSDDSIWIADGEGDEVFRLLNDGTKVGQIPVGALPNGLSVDLNGKIWVLNQDSDNVMRIDPAIDSVDLTVDLEVGSQPFSLSDMTGTLAFNTTLQDGHWKVITDGGEPGTDWDNVSWTKQTPGTSLLTVSVRSSDDEASLEGMPWVVVSGAGGIDETGRFLQTLVKFEKSTGGESPVLFDLTVEGDNSGPSGCVVQNRRDPGSLLLFPEFDNRPGTISIFTVTHVDCDADDDLLVEFLYIDEDDCLEFNRTEVLTPCDTLTLITNKHSPQKNRGYVYVFAKDPSTGEAIVANVLVGSSMLANGLDAFDYGMNPVVFAGLGVGGLTDVDNDGVRDLDGIEYEMAPDSILVPRFLGQSGNKNPRNPALHSDLILIGLTGGVEFDTVLDFLIYNDNEEVFSSEYTFHCWEKVPLLQISGVFADSFLRDWTDHDSGEILGAPGRESGWFRIDGAVAYSTVTSIPDPAFYAVLVEHMGIFGVADLPFEYCSQDNGELLPDGLYGR